jgi:DNA helicase IV
VRDGDEVPIFVRAETRQDVIRLAVEQTKTLAERLGDASTGVVCPDSMVDEISAALQLLGVDHGRASTAALDNAITVVPVSLVKGLELDGVVVVEPAAIVSDELHGLRALYVALTRSTRSLVIVHHQELPEAMR